jgi:hypothetical protein
MNIELMIEGKKKNFKLPSFIPGRMVRKAVSFTKMDLTNISEEDLDDLVEFVANVYGDKFTIDDFYDGIDSREMLKVLGYTIEFIVNGTIDAAGGTKDPNK